ncbi:phosphatidylinositol 3-kinase regulatory subunit alpha-like [Glandiceps talaboti]
MAVIVRYEAVSDFLRENFDQSYIEIHKGDILKVHNPQSSPDFDGSIEEPNCWLKGLNERTEEVGHFPGTYVKYLSMSSALPLPPPPAQRPLPPRRPSKTTSVDDSVNDDSGFGGSPIVAPRRHNLSDAYFSTPILCKHCNDYIWGFGRAGKRCELCHCCFHHDCYSFESNYSCERKDPSSSSDYCRLSEPVSQWNVEKVLNWMAVTNLYRYAELFKSKDIDGAKLEALDDGTLIRLGITDEFRRQCILITRDELCRGSSVMRESTTMNPSAVGEEANRPASDHQFQEHSFSSLQWCDKCNKFMFGLVRQGLQCQDCGYSCHRSCAMTGLPVCNTDSGDRVRRDSYGPESVFNQDLTVSFEPPAEEAPQVVIKCVEEIEQKGMDTELIYHKNASTPAINRIKEAFNQNVASDLTVYDVHCIAGALKMFFSELPNPVIPTNMYSDFIHASSIRDDSDSTTQLFQLMQRMPEHHRLTLQYLIKHLHRVCLHSRTNRMTPRHLASVFSNALLCPPREKIMEVLHNNDAHRRVVELLITRCGATLDGSEENIEEAPPPIPPRNQSSMDVPKTMEESEWYWGDISRDYVNEILKDTPDGTFLVRDATNKASGGYTLTLRKGGSNKLIKIYYRNGLYGFSEPLVFKSVIDLIEHYKDVSLAQYNSKLDVKLSYPVSKKAEQPEAQESDIDKVKERLKEINEEYKDKTESYDKLYEMYNKSTQEIQLRRQALEAFNETIKAFEEQIKIHEIHHKDAIPPDERQRLMENYGLLKSRVEEIKVKKEQLEFELKRQAEENRNLDREMNSLKPDIIQLRKLRDQYVMYLGAKGTKQDEINRLLGIEQLGTVTQTITEVEALPHHDEQLWFLPEISRGRAIELLMGKPNGTFLIRKSSQVSPDKKPNYACSLVADSEVRHCMIIRSDKGYGYAEPFTIFKTLKELVLHYQQNSLLQHNDQLDTTLAYPVYGPSPPTDNDINR